MIAEAVKQQKPLVEETVYNFIGSLLFGEISEDVELTAPTDTGKQNINNVSNEFQSVAKRASKLCTLILYIHFSILMIGSEANSWTGDNGLYCTLSRGSIFYVTF